MGNRDYLEQFYLEDTMHIGVGEVCKYENTCFSFGKVVVEGELHLKDCSLIASETKIFVKGKLRMEDCEVNKPGSGFLQIASDANTILDSCVIHCTVPFHDSVIIARDNYDFEIRDCRFHGAPTVISMMAERNGITVQPFTVPFVDANKGKIIGCEFNNFTGCRVANALRLIATTFTKCHRIEVGGSGEMTRVSRCRFKDCKEVNVYDGTVECCEFRHIESAFFNLSSVIGCSFSGLMCDFDHIITLDDRNVTNCTFDDIELIEDSYLIDATDESSLEHCSFKNCRTSRDDLMLVHCEGVKGKIFKKKVVYDIVDHHSCTGLDEVERVLLKAICG